MTATTVTFPGRLAAQLSDGIPRPFWALLVGTFITKAGAFVVPFLFVYLTQARGMDLLLGGSIVSLFGLGSFLGSLAGGALADRLGRKVTMLASLVIGAAFLLVLGVSTELWQIALATFLMGLTGDAYRPASQALVADLIEPRHRMKAFGMQYWAINLGFAFASVIGGALAAKNFSALFIGDAATTLVLAAIIFRAVPETRPRGAPGAAKGGSLVTPFLDRVFAPFLVLNYLVAVIFFQHLTTMAEDMRSKGLTTQTLGLSLATNGILIVLLQPLATKWAQRFQRSTVLALATALTGVGFGLNAWADSLGTYAAAIAVWTLGEILFAPVNASIVAELSPEHLRGRYQGAFTITFSLAAMTAPLIGTASVPWLGHAGFWGACLGVALAVAAAHLTWTARVLPRAEPGRTTA